MNIFENRNRFFGKPNFISIQNHIDEFWNLSREIKNELGGKGYYLDEYLHLIFETLADIDLLTASCIADSIYSSILKDCYIIFDDTPIHEKSKFFEFVKKYVDEHPLDFEEDHTKVEFYGGKIILENLEMLNKEFKDRYKDKILTRIDYPAANELFKKISSIVGKEKAEHFNDVIAEAFVFGPICISISQHLVARAIGMLLYCDPESSKQIYQLVVDKKI